jgi:hypothetical protein
MIGRRNGERTYYSIQPTLWYSEYSGVISTVNTEFVIRELYPLNLPQIRRMIPIFFAQNVTTLFLGKGFPSSSSNETIIWTFGPTVLHPRKARNEESILYSIVVTPHIIVVGEKGKTLSSDELPE